VQAQEAGASGDRVAHGLEPTAVDSY
jgi:hypothetical protein